VICRPMMVVCLVFNTYSFYVTWRTLRVRLASYNFVPARSIPAGTGRDTSLEKIGFGSDTEILFQLFRTYFLLFVYKKINANLKRDRERKALVINHLKLIDPLHGIHTKIYTCLTPVINI